MRTSAIVRIILFSLLALLLTGVLIIGLCGGFSSLKNGLFSIGNRYDQTGYQIGEGTVVLSLDDIQKVEINWTAGTVSISPSETDEITFFEDASSPLKADDQMRYKVHNGTLFIQYRASQRFIHLGNTDKQLTMLLPQRLLELYVKTTSAQIQIEGVTVRDAELEVVSGNLTTTDFVAQQLEIHSVSGDVNAAGDFEMIEAESVSGEIAVASMNCPHEAELESVSGTLYLTLPENSQFTADYETVSGSFNCQFATVNRGGRIVCGKGGADLSFSTVSGDISIDQSSGGDAVQSEQNRKQFAQQ